MTGMTRSSRRVHATLTRLSERYTAPDERAYLSEHARRYAVLLELVARIARGVDDGVRILDVGPAYQTEALRELLRDATVDTLGFADDRFAPRDGERHFEFDLNDAQHQECWPELPSYDVIVMGEVLEHLHTSPVLVLRFLATGLRPGGHLLLQTPNAAALPNRLRLLVGRNPFEQIRETPRNPGHFREYTVDELLTVARAAGLEPVWWRTANYFERGSLQNRVANGVGRLLPARLRSGITIVLRK